jgi:hypothetical protein
MALHPPIIILGMHRSGTSVLTRLLAGLGVFTGKRLDRNDEPAFFVDCNNWLMRQAGASWHTPEPMRQLLTEPQARRWSVDYLSQIITGPAAMRYLGVRRWLRDRRLTQVSEPWAWKDPRTVFTLPLWLELFPQAKVIHIRRHGIDVAASLKRRREQALGKTTERYQCRRALSRLNPWAPKRSGFGHAPRCATIEGGLDLWAAYMTEAEGHLAGLGGRAIDLRYEDLLAEPVDTLQRIAAFCGLSGDPTRLGQLTGPLNADRAFAHQGDEALVESAIAHGELLQRHGYANPVSQAQPRE